MSDWKELNDKDMDALFLEALPDMPPEGAVERVNPWRRPLNLVIWSLALTMVTLNFAALQYILPALGLVLSVLGFRGLRKERGGFRACWWLTVLRVAVRLAQLFLFAAIWQETAWGQSLNAALLTVNILSEFLILCCLRSGIRSLQARSGVQPHTGAATGLIIWYVVLTVLGILGAKGILGWGMILCYVLLLWGLWKLPKELGEAGYTVATVPSKLTDRALGGLLALAMVAAVAAGYLADQGYPMDWQVHTQASGEKVEEICDDLLELGYPADILKDLTEEEILSLEGATQVIVEQSHYPMNDGRQVVEQVDGVIHHYTVFDVREVRATNILVRLPEDDGREVWQVLHHVLWVEDVKFYGTECVELRSTCRDGLSWWPIGDCSGRVLYTHGDVDYAAPYYSLDYQTYTQDSILWGQQTSRNLMGLFTFPNFGSGQRAYVTYKFEQNGSHKSIIDSWLFYTHQEGWWEYPARSAFAYRKTGASFLWDEFEPFHTIISQIQE